MRKSVYAEFAPDPALLEPAERRSRVENVVAIHPHRARAHAIRNRMRLADVFGPYCRRKPIQGLVGPLDDLAHVLQLQYRHHWPEDVFRLDLHIILPVREPRGLAEIPLVAAAP